VFRLPEGDIAIVTRNLRRGADTVLTLLDANGQDVTEDDDGGGGLASRLEVAAADARPAFVRARVLGEGAGEFDLVVEADVAGPPTFPTSLQAAMDAPMLQPGVAIPIRLRRGQSAYFMLPPGAHVVATRELRDGTDTVLELLDTNGQVLAEDDDGGDGLASRLAVDGAGQDEAVVVVGVLANQVDPPRRAEEAGLAVESRGKLSSQQGMIKGHQIVPSTLDSDGILPRHPG